MKKIIFLIAIFFPFLSLLAQSEIRGKVVEKLENGKEIPLVGANVYWKNDPEAGVITDNEGNYSILEPNTYPSKLIISFIGYKTHIEEVKRLSSLYVVLLPSIELDDVDINSKKNTTKFSTINPLNIQTLSTGELEKAACCNLSESFSTNAAVDVHFSDAVSGAKKIEMLGLYGVYTQITQENMPLIQGLSSAYGLTYIPGTWIESIQIIKGSGSVVNGFESLTGQINLEYYKPTSAPKLFWNGYVNSHGRLENNLLFAKKQGNWKSNLFTHVTYFKNEYDHNHDGFLDMPTQTQFNILNRWEYQGDYHIDITARALIDDRIGGTINGAVSPYLVDVHNELIELSTKTGALQKNIPGKSFGLQTLFRRHYQTAIFGINNYKALQERAYLNFLRQTYIGNTDHKLMYGISYSADRYTESFVGHIDDTITDKIHSDLIGGFFSEYSYKSKENLSVVSGVRSDYYNELGKFYILPRVNIKYNPTEKTAVRLSAGRALRIPNMLSENISLLASNRSIVLTELSPEIAWNYGINFNYCFRMFSREGTINTDFYRSLFENQIVIDIEEQSRLLFYNLDGSSYSNSFQFDFAYDLSERFDVRVSYKVNDVKTTFEGIHKKVPLIPNQRGLFNISYATYFDKLVIDFTTNYVGESRIPQHELNEINCYSDPFYLFNSQITKRFRHFDVYIGMENISDYRQKNPILAADNTSSELFDASLIYAPISGRMGYLGFRFKIK